MRIDTNYQTRTRSRTSRSVRQPTSGLYRVGPGAPARAVRSLRPRRQQGAAAVELALLMPIMLLFLLLPFGYARFMWHYTAAQKAAHDAARYMAGIPELAIITRSHYYYAAKVASEIVATELAELDPDGGKPTIEVLCEPYRCAEVYAGPPDTMRIHVAMTISNPFQEMFGVGNGKFTLDINAREKYVGRWER